MITPQDIKIKVEEEKKGYGKFIIEPLPQGYGHTLGNALRRVLLSSLPGAAITQVKFTGVPHQFSTIPGVSEDVVDLTLNLKKIRLKIFAENPVVIKLLAQGPKEVKAGDLEVPPEAEVVNKNLHLATLADKKTKLEVELIAEPGVGYVPSKEREITKIGVIPLDAIFTPILLVSYQVELTRVGQITNLDRLILEITTDETITPKEALKKASEILTSFFARLESGKKEIKKEVPKEEKKIPPRQKQILIEELDLPTRVVNALERAEIKTVGNLVEKSGQELEKLRGLGEKSVKVIKKALKKEGIEYASSSKG